MVQFFDQFFRTARRTCLPVALLGRLLSTMLVLSLLAIWLIFGGILYESYMDEWKSASFFVGNVDNLLEQDIGRNLAFYDVSLKDTAAGLNNPDTMKLPPQLRKRVLFGASTPALGLNSILIMDRSGTLIAESTSEVPRTFNGADRDYFHVHVDGALGQALFISHPFNPRLQNGTWVLGVSRRLQSSDGSFAGVVLGAIKLSFFTQLFATVDLPPDSVITLIHDDGTILMRSPATDIGRNFADTSVFRDLTKTPAGQVTGTSTIDGVERLIAYKHVGDMPVMLSVGIPTRHFLNRWRWRQAFVALGFLVLSALILVLAVTLGRELQRRTLAEKALSELALTDGLTALANRRHFDEVLEVEWRRAIRGGTSVALLMVDGDFFKFYNDTYGHVQGDQALRAIAGALRDSIKRPADLVARFGGEEFVILLPGTDLDGAIQVGETVIAAVKRLEIAHARSPYERLTVSIGVAACLPLETGVALSLVQAADFALYEAKENGRNRIATGERLDLTSFGWRAAAQ